MQQHSFKPALLAAGIFAAGFSGNAVAYAVMWQNGQITTLGAPAGVDPTKVSATAINNNGQVLVSYNTTTQNNFGAIWNNGNYNVLGNLAGGAASDRIYANDLNDSGLIVGGITDNFGQNSRAVTWNSSGVASLLPTPSGSVYSFANGINANGQIVGVSYDANWQASVLLWSNGGYTNLGLLPGDYDGVANAINEQGRVVGNSGFISAVSWNNGSLSNLGVLPGFETSSAADINSNDWVVGNSHTESGGFGASDAATLWHDGQKIDLGWLPGATAGSVASAINDLNQIVGTSFTHDSHSKATLWQNSQIIDLGGLPGAARYGATDINNLGQIVGTSDGVAPVPLPAAVWLFGSSLCGFIGAARRNRSA